MPFPLRQRGLDPERFVMRSTAKGRVSVVRPLAEPARSIAARGGARAIVEDATIAIEDRAGRLVATFDGETGALTITASADLRLSAPAGRVSLEARDGIELATSNGGARLDLADQRVSLRATEADVDVGAWTMRAGRVVERLGDAYRTVDGLVETRAKRLRTLVAGTLELFGRRTTIQSEKDTRIDGERVRLG
jgi:hypothetical protein